MKVHKLTDLWQTPPEEIAFARRVFGGKIDLDPCAATDTTVPVCNKDGKIQRIHSNPTRHAETNLDAKADGLAAMWFGNVFVNPPYSELLMWCQACVRWAEKPDISVLALLPATPATRWWQMWVARATAVCLCADRVNFLDSEGHPGKNPRHDVAWVLWGGARLASRFHDLCILEKRGCVMRPYAYAAHEAQQPDLFFGSVPQPP